MGSDAHSIHSLATFRSIRSLLRIPSNTLSNIFLINHGTLLKLWEILSLPLENKRSRLTVNFRSNLIPINHAIAQKTENTESDDPFVRLE